MASSELGTGVRGNVLMRYWLIFVVLMALCCTHWFILNPRIIGIGMGTIQQRKAGIVIAKNINSSADSKVGIAGKKKSSSTDINNSSANDTTIQKPTSIEPSNSLTTSLHTLKTRTRTTTPGLPRPQYIFHIHYHKTGHDITHQYNNVVGAVCKTNAVGGEGVSTLFVKSIRDMVYTHDDNGKTGIYITRTHDKVTGCPNLAYLPLEKEAKLELYVKYTANKTYKTKIKRRKNSKNKNRLLTSIHNTTTTISTSQIHPTSRIHLAVFPAPDFLCNLSEHDIFFQNISNAKVIESPKWTGRQELLHSYFREHIRPSVDGGPNHDVKFIHMIRDPFDMAVSNYLYHSQNPTPEHWVKQKGIQPCLFNREFLKFVVRRDDDDNEDNERTAPKALLTVQQVDALEEICIERMLNPITGESYENLYDALLALPPFDGLKLATTFLMVGRHKIGTDLVRMTNNVLRLNEWQQHQRQSTNHSTGSSVLSLMMDTDWSGEHYEESLNRLTDFLLDDIEVLQEEDSSNIDEHRNSHNTVDKAAAAEEERTGRQEFKAMVVKEAGAKRKNRQNGEKSHFTKASEDRLELKAKLQADEFFGPILYGYQAIIHTASGLKNNGGM